MNVVEVDVLGEDNLELASDPAPGKDHHPVETLAADGAGEALCKGFGPPGLGPECG